MIKSKILIIAALSLISTLASPEYALTQANSGTLNCRSTSDSTPLMPAPGGGSEVSTGGVLEVGDILPQLSERLLSTLSLTGEIQDTQDFFTRTVEIAGPSNREPRTVVEFLPNPDQYLWKATLTVSPSQMFLSASDLETAYGAVAKNRKLFRTDYDPLSLVDDELGYFSRSRRADRAGRVLSSVTFSVAVSQRPSLDGQSTLPDPVINEDRAVQTYSVKIDPLSWFVTGTEKASAYSALGAYAKAYKKSEAVETLLIPCKNQNDRDCLRELSGLSGRGRFWVAVLPVFEYKSVDQFDFVNAGGRYLFAPLVEDTIETYTVTWDLKRAFKASKERISALSAVQAAADLRSPAPSIEPVGILRISRGELFYLRLRAKNGIKDLTWNVLGSTCSEAATNIPLKGITLEGDGLLSGYPENELQACEFLVSVTDAVGRSTQVICSVTPE